MSVRGHLITLEGGEGAGKSTCLRTAVEALVAAGVDVKQAREPGGTPLGERLREILLDPETGEIAPDAEALMMFAARAQLVASVIEPSLAAGSFVISDRFTDASYAYQGGGRGMASERIASLEQWTLGELRPSLTLLLDIPPEKGLQRATARREADRFEHEHIAFYERVRATYLERAAAEPERVMLIDATRPIEEVTAQVAATINGFVHRVRHD